MHGARRSVACETTGNRPLSIGDILLERGKITLDQLDTAVAARKSPYDRIDKILVQLGFVTEHDVLEIQGEQMSLEVVDLSDTDLDPAVLKEVPARLVHKRGIIPIERTNSTLKVATADPYSAIAA